MADAWFMDTWAAIEEGLRRELARHKELEAEIESLDEATALELGREAGRAVLAPLIWRRLLGEDRFDTSAAARLLGVTRQALHKGARARRLLAVPGRGTTWYPAWQFDIEARRVREPAQDMFSAWADVLSADYDPQTLLAWACAPQPELDNSSPRDWILKDGDRDRLVAAARHGARGLAA
jgi:hypothetical protein